MRDLASKLLIFTAVLTSFSPSVSAQSDAQDSEILPAGTYYAQGSMYNNSRREIARQDDKICIKIVDGPASPYKGIEAITISSVSVKEGKFYVDASGQELVVKDDGRAFSGDIRGVWEYESASPDRRSQPIQNEKMAECLSARGEYVENLEGISIPGIDFPNSR